MRVRFLNGVKAGEISDLPSLAIIRSPALQPSSPRQPHLASPIQVPVRGSLRVGATVMLNGDGAGFRWTVKQILADGEVEIETTIFERPTCKKVSRDRLQLVGPLTQPRRSQAASLEVVSDRGDDDFDQSEWISKNLSPVHPQRDLDAILDSIVFSQRCLQSYRDRFYKGHSITESADHLRGEIRSRGVVERDEQRGMVYGWLRVPHRFDVTLPANFRTGVATTIDDPECIIDRRRRRTARRASKRRPGGDPSWKGRAAAA